MNTIDQTRLPPKIEKLLAAAEISTSGGNPISIHEVDRAIKHLPISERLEIKCALRAAGRIA